MYGAFDNSGIHSLNGQQFKTHWTDTITSPPKFGPLTQTAFDIAKILFATFYLIF